MRHASTPSLCAAAAIAAALTLGTTPAAAQNATPSLDLESLESTQPLQAPEAAEAPEDTAASPTASSDTSSSDVSQSATPMASDPAEPATTFPVVPSTVGETDNAPVIAAEPPAALASTGKSTAPPAERAEPTRSAQADRAPTPAVPAADEGNGVGPSADSDVTDLMAETGEGDLTAAPMMNGALPSGSIVNPAVAATSAADAPAEDPFSIPEESIVALLAALGLSAAGFMAMRSRRRREKPARRRRSTLMAATAFEAKPRTNSTMPEVFKPKTAFTTPDVPEPKTNPMTSDEPPTSIPDKPSAKPEVEEEPVPTAEVRQKLIQEMVAAPPDKNNPFTSLRARRKRARMILQRRENEHGQQGGKPFDWRMYKPTTKSRNPSSPPLVSA